MRAMAMAAALGLVACSGNAVHPGDRVVSRWRSSFWEGTVEKVEPNLLTVQWDVPPPEHSVVPPGWVSRIAPWQASPGWALCRDDETWSLCEVREVGGNRVKVATAYGLDEPSQDDVLPVPPALAAWAKKEGPRLLAIAAAKVKVKGARPARVGGALPVGSAVLAQWTDGNWWEGRVGAQVEGSGVPIDWLDGSHGEVHPEQVAALVPVGERAEEGMLAICRWQQQTRWWRAVVERKRGAHLKVLYEDGTRGDLTGDDCVAAQ